MEQTDILKEIEGFAYRYLDKREIAIVCGLKNANDLSDDSSPEGLAFQRGRLKRKAEFNYAIIQLSNQLSSPAQAIELKIAERTALNDKKRV